MHKKEVNVVYIMFYVSVLKHPKSDGLSDRQGSKFQIPSWLVLYIVQYFLQLTL